MDAEQLLCPGPGMSFWTVVRLPKPAAEQNAVVEYTSEESGQTHLGRSTHASDFFVLSHWDRRAELDLYGSAPCSEPATSQVSDRVRFHAGLPSKRPANG
ncbi:MAG: hypothetical protein HY795_18535 [Desulfovibrio sp.]|nr:hypothetical protein [Desulfovibrio sp.]